MMERRIVNPWTWQDRAGFVQANEVRDASGVLFCAGVVSVDDEGMPVHEGNMQAQALRALDNLETILVEAGYTLADVVRLITYVVNADDYVQARPALPGTAGPSRLPLRCDPPRRLTARAARVADRTRSNGRRVDDARPRLQSAGGAANCLAEEPVRLIQRMCARLRARCVW